MAWYELIWEWDDDDGNVAHIAQHDLTPGDVETVIENPIGHGKSESSGRPIAFGYARDGCKIAVVYEQLDDATPYPITAFEVD